MHISYKITSTFTIFIFVISKIIFTKCFYSFFYIISCNISSTTTKSCSWKNSIYFHNI